MFDTKSHPSEPGHGPASAGFTEARPLATPAEALKLLDAPRKPFALERLLDAVRGYA